MNRGTVRRLRRSIRRRAGGWFGPPPPVSALLLLFGDGGAWAARMLPSRARLVELLGPGAPALLAISDRDSTAARMRERGHEARSLEAAFREPGSGGTRRVLELLDEAERDRDVRAALATPEFLERVPTPARALERMRAVVEAGGARRSATASPGPEGDGVEIQLAPTILAPSAWIDVARAERVLHEIRRPAARAEIFETLAPGPRVPGKENGGERGAKRFEARETTETRTSDTALAPVRFPGWRTGVADGKNAGDGPGSDSVGCGGDSWDGAAPRLFLRIARPALRHDALGRIAASGVARELVVHALPGEPLGIVDGRIAGVPCERMEDLPRFLDRVFEECGGATASSPGRGAILVTDSETEPLPFLEAGLRMAITGPGAGVAGNRAGARLRELEVLEPGGVPIFRSTRELVAALASGARIASCAPPPRLARDESRFDEGFAEWLGERFGGSGRGHSPSARFTMRV